MKRQIKLIRSQARSGARQPLPEGRRGKLRLDMNENLFGCSPRVLAAMRNLDQDAMTMYPEKEAAIGRLARYFGVRPEEMALTAGTDEALRLIADVFVERGRTVLLVEPTFPMYRFYSEQRGGRVRALGYDEAMRFPLEAVRKALAGHPGVFFLANPNNPTGTLVPRRSLRQVVEAAERTLVVVDEAYFEFAGVTVLPWIRRRRNLVVTRTFSKAAGLAGLRFGCLFAHRDVMKIFRRAQSPYPVSAAAIAAAEAALRDRRFLHRSLREARQSRELLARGLARLGVRRFPSGGNFLLADFGARAPGIVEGLEKRGILLRDRAKDFGRSGPVRITVGTPAQMRLLLHELERLL